MKQKLGLSLIVLLLFLFTFGLGYRGGFARARKGTRVIVAMDTSDSRQPSGRAEYEPFFSKQNAVPDNVK